MLNVKRVQAITIDLDDTLWPVRPTLEQAYGALLDWLQEQAPGAAMLLNDRSFVTAARKAIARQQPSVMHDVGAVMRQMIASALHHARADMALTEPAFALYYAQRQRVTLFDDALPALEHLAQRYRLVALTNGNADIHAIGLTRYFEASISAADVGAAKPEAAMFEAAAAAMQVQPEQILHVGDDPRMDGMGALQLDMQMVWINREQADWPYARGRRPHLIAPDLSTLRQWL